MGTRWSSRSGARFPTLIDRYLIRKLLAPFIAIMAGVILILELERAMRLLVEMATNGTNVRYFLPLLAQMLPYYINMALPFAFLLAVILLLARLDEDRELQALMAHGVSMRRMALPLAVAGGLVALFAILTSGWLEPIARFHFRTMRAEAIASGKAGLVLSGAFYQPSADFVILIEQAHVGKPSRVFAMQQNRGYEDYVLTARSAALTNAPDRRSVLIRFHDGQVWHHTAHATRYGSGVLSFHDLALTVPRSPVDAGGPRGLRDVREMTLPELLAPGIGHLRHIGGPPIKAELAARLAKATIIPFLPALLLPLIMAVRQRSRVPGALIAGLLLVITQHGINFTRQRAAAGPAESWLLIPLITLGFVVLVVVVFQAGRNLPSHSPLSRITDWMASWSRRFSRLLAWPHLPGLGVRRHVLALYLVRITFGCSMIVLLALVLLLGIAEIFLLGDAFVRRGLGGEAVLYYSLLRVPALALQAMPAAALLGPVTAFYLFVRRREMMSVRLLGLSRYQILRLILPVPLALGAISFALAEWVVPHSEQQFHAWWQPDRNELQSAPDLHWLHMDRAIMRVRDISSDGRSLGSPTLFLRAADGNLLERIDARNGHHDPQGWALGDATIFRLGTGAVRPVRKPLYHWRTSLRPDQLLIEAHGNSAFSARWAQQVLKGSVPAARGDVEYTNRMMRGWSGPVMPLAMLLLALPVALSGIAPSQMWRPLLFATLGGATAMVADGLLGVMAMFGEVSLLSGAWLSIIVSSTASFTLLAVWDA